MDGKEFYNNWYQNKASRTINNKLSNHEIEFHALHGLSSEVGEIHDIYQKTYQGHEYNEDHVKEEIGDLLWFIAELCTARGWNMCDIAADNIGKLEQRYPEGFDEGRSVNRHE